MLAICQHEICWHGIFGIKQKYLAEKQQTTFITKDAKLLRVFKMAENTASENCYMPVHKKTKSCAE